MRIKLSTTTFLWTLVGLLLFMFALLYERFASMSNLPFNLMQLPFSIIEIGNIAMIAGFVALGIAILLALFLAVNHVIFSIRCTISFLKRSTSQKDREKTQSPELKTTQELRNDIKRVMITRRISNRILRK